MCVVGNGTKTYQESKLDTILNMPCVVASFSLDKLSVTYCTVYYYYYTLLFKNKRIILVLRYNTCELLMQ